LGRNDKLVTPEEFVEIFRKDMAAYDSLNYEYRKFFVVYRRRTMIQPEMLAMPRGMDYIGAREWKNDLMLSKLIAEIVMRKHPQPRHNVTGPENKLFGGIRSLGYDNSGRPIVKGE
jgi:hypothetical protein